MHCKCPNEESHSIVCEDEFGEKVIVPLFLKGVTSYFNTEPLTREEFEAHDPSWRPSRRPSPNVSPRSVDEISLLTDDMKSMKRTVDNQKITIAKLTARLEQSDDDATLFSSEESVGPPASNITNSALVQQKRRKTKATTRR